MLFVGSISFLGGILPNWTVSGMEILAQAILSLLFRVDGSSNVPLSPFRPLSESQTILNAFLKDASFGPPLNLHIFNSLVEFSKWFEPRSISSSWISRL